MSGERLQDNWSSGLSLFIPILNTHSYYMIGEGVCVFCFTPFGREQAREQALCLNFVNIA